MPNCLYRAVLADDHQIGFQETEYEQVANGYSVEGYDYVLPPVTVKELGYAHTRQAAVTLLADRYKAEAIEQRKAYQDCLNRVVELQQDEQRLRNWKEPRG